MYILFFRYIKILFLVCFITQHSCIEPYYPENQLNFNSKLVVDGLLTDESENQVIKLSYTSKIDTITINPLSGSFVEVFDRNGYNFVFNESSEEPGTYKGIIPLTHFYQNNSFQLHFILPGGEEYESSIETYKPSNPGINIHCSRISKESNDPELVYDGLQFYLDYRAGENENRYYRIKIEETWEYHSAFPITIYYSGGYHKVKPDSSLYFCYQSNILDDLFLLSTNGFEKNEYLNFKLHYVNNTTPRLKNRYSILVKQYSLSDEMYIFWQNIAKNNQQNGGLFSTQPAFIKGNITYINHPEEQVLGYFGISSVIEKRIFIEPPENLKFIENNICIPSVPYTEGGWPGNTTPNEWPIYFIYFYDIISESSVLGVAPPECFDCTLLGGSVTKPAFW
ncbi:MAG: hypothetical protein A2W95_14280 [Bacteroidetes bacterium GWA2_40_14]|jgi:hypothetical protein|nr:MAG: hypothetical protein A2W95_14280 [Bacteroidetes bacterium GWA2_40_14]